MSLLLAVEHTDYLLTIFVIGVIAGYLGYMIGSQRDKKQAKAVFNASTYEEETEPPVRQRSRSWSVLEIGTRSKTYHNPQKPSTALKRLREMAPTWISILASYASLISLCTGEADKASSLSDSTEVSQENHLSSAGVGSLPIPTGVQLPNKNCVVAGSPHSILLWLDRGFPGSKLITFEQQHPDPFLDALGRRTVLLRDYHRL